MRRGQGRPQAGRADDGGHDRVDLGIGGDGAQGRLAVLDLGSQALASQQAAQNNVAASDAGVLAAQANVDRADAAMKDAETTADRTQKLVDAGAAPAMNLPTAQSALDQAAAQKQQAIAQVAQAKAQAQANRSQVSQAQAQVAQAKAAVDLAQVNLTHTVIEAPIDGVVVSRSVDVGQTVAASLQAPTVFRAVPTERPVSSPMVAP